MKREAWSEGSVVREVQEAWNGERVVSGFLSVLFHQNCTETESDQIKKTQDTDVSGSFFWLLG